MKKFIAIIMATAIAVSFCACGGSESVSSAVSNSSDVSDKASSSLESSLKAASENSLKESSAGESSVKQSSEKESSNNESSKKESSKTKTSKSENSKSEGSKTEASQLSEEIEQSQAESKNEAYAESSQSPAESSFSEQPQQQIVESSIPESRIEESSMQKKTKKRSVSSNESPVDASWFDDALFIGDSVTLKLSYYADNGSLGDAEFLCAGSLGYNNALWDIDYPDNVHPSYNGVKYTVDEGAGVIDPAKIFIMLGMNDIGAYGVDGAINAMQQLLSKIEKNCPDAEIYVESVTPMLKESQLKMLNNTTIAQFDSKAEELCKEKGYHYLDIASAVEDEDGNLIYEYCSDASAMGLHFSDSGCYQWVEYLKNHV